MKDKLTAEDFDPEVLQRVREFKQQHGVEWRFILSSAWASGSDAMEYDGYLLRRARNLYGSDIINFVHKEKP